MSSPRATADVSCFFKHQLSIFFTYKQLRGPLALEMSAVCVCVRACVDFCVLSASRWLRWRCETSVSHTSVSNPVMHLIQDKEVQCTAGLVGSAFDAVDTRLHRGWCIHGEHIWCPELLHTLTHTHTHTPVFASTKIVHVVMKVLLFFLVLSVAVVFLSLPVITVCNETRRHRTRSVTLSTSFFCSCCLYVLFFFFFEKCL
jgi:hypothetical protein